MQLRLDSRVAKAKLIGTEVRHRLRDSGAGANGPVAGRRQAGHS